MSGEMTGLAAIVTGGASGLGAAIADRLAGLGARVAVLDLNPPAKGSSPHLGLACDVSDDASVRAAVAQAAEAFGGLDVVVNNAGYGYLAAVEEIADDAARAMFEVQVFGVLNVLRAVLPGFRNERSGHIINVSSIVGLVPFPGWGLYGAGKFALEALTESLAGEVAEYGIAVNLVEPGYMRTDFLRPVSIGLPERTTDAYPAIREMVHQHLEKIPGTQPGDPARAADAIISVAVRGAAPLHQLLGSDSLGLMENRIRSLSADAGSSRALAMTTDILQP